MGEFSCYSGDQCVPERNRCDGRFDCRDRSDELNCPPTRPGGEGELNLRTYPTEQTIEEGEFTFIYTFKNFYRHVYFCSQGPRWCSSVAMRVR